MRPKRFIAMFLVAALMISALTFTASAETSETVSVGVVAETVTPILSNPYVVNQGDEVSVRVTIRENTGVSFLRIKVGFDAEALEYVGFESKKLISTDEVVTYNDENGYLLYYVNLFDNVSTATGDILEITFKANSGYCGETRIYTELVNGRPANCFRSVSATESVHVPYTSEDAVFSIHNITSEGIVHKPTCIYEGYTEYRCDECKERFEGDYTSKTAHTFGEDTVVEPGYKTAGYTYRICEFCKYEYRYDYTSPLTYIVGDVDCNGEVSSDDAIYLLYNTLFPEDYPVEQECDYNGDGLVDSDDAIYLLYYTLFPEDYPLQA